jgi:hypothetical protein
MQIPLLIGYHSKTLYASSHNTTLQFAALPEKITKPLIGFTRGAVR